jgi:anti-sigma B factor antagonist
VVKTVSEQHNFRVWLTDGLPVISTPAELDVTNTAQLRTALLAASRQCATVVVDMSQTAFCDSASLSALLRARQRAMADGGEVRLVITTAQVLRIFALTGVDRLFPIFVSLTEALGSVPGTSGAPRDPLIVSLAVVTSPLPHEGICRRMAAVRRVSAASARAGSWRAQDDREPPAFCSVVACTGIRGPSDQSVTSADHAGAAGANP